MKCVGHMRKDSEAQRIRKNTSIMILEFLIIFNIAAALLNEREKDRRERLAVKDKRACE
jgi:hypothetical protein